MRNQFTDVTRLAEALVFNNFNNIQFGEPELQNALSHNFEFIFIVVLIYSTIQMYLPEHLIRTI